MNRTGCTLVHILYYLHDCYTTPFLATVLQLRSAVERHRYSGERVCIRGSISVILASLAEHTLLDLAAKLDGRFTPAPQLCGCWLPVMRSGSRPSNMQGAVMFSLERNRGRAIAMERNSPMLTGTPSPEQRPRTIAHKASVYLVCS